MANTKVKAPTQKEQFADIIAILEGCDNPKSERLIQFCNERIAKLEKKAVSANSKKNAEDEKFFDLIADVLADGKGKRATEVFNVLSKDMDGLTIQKVTAMLTKMVAANRVTKTVEKKVSTFALNFGVDGEGEDAE
jgi:hypothetical protein